MYKLKYFAAGLAAGLIGLTTVYAAGGIGSAQFNANKVVYNGQQLDLSSAQMVSIVKEGEQNASNYMPVRAVLEQMGYEVSWDGATNTVSIDDKGMKIGLDDNFFGGTLRDMFVGEGINVDAALSKEALEEFNKVKSMLNMPESLWAVFYVKDYQVWNEGGDAFLNEYWEIVFK